jgi:Subtilase family
MNVDILSMSFGWHERNLQINKALGKAQDHQVMFAAASNDGERGHSGPTFPAQKLRVFCINACDALGTPANFNPPALKGNSFMTLGLGIESYWKSERVYKSGTSFATPMAAAMVANALEFTRHQCGTAPIPDEACAFLNSFDGVRKLIELMTNQSTTLERPHPYTYMDPSRIWDRKRDRSDIADLFIAACRET